MIGELMTRKGRGFWLVVINFAHVLMFFGENNT